MNDTTVWCQNASVTEPQREGGTRSVTEGESVYKQIHTPVDGRFVKRPYGFLRSRSATTLTE